MYEWVELMTKERLDLESAELYVSRCNSPGDLTRLSSTSPPHSRPLSVLTEGERYQVSDLNSSLSQRSCSPPAGGVFATLYRPQSLARPSSSHRHSSYISRTVEGGARGPSRQTASLLKHFDEALADYKQLENRRKLKNKIETERYFDNLAALLRLDDVSQQSLTLKLFLLETSEGL